jgi:hypothetical protein
MVDFAPSPLQLLQAMLRLWYRRVGGPKSQSGQVRQISPLPGFDPQTEYYFKVVFYIVFTAPWLHINI